MLPIAAFNSFTFSLASCSAGPEAMGIWPTVSSFFSSLSTSELFSVRPSLTDSHSIYSDFPSHLFNVLQLHLFVTIFTFSSSTSIYIFLVSAPRTFSFSPLPLRVAILLLSFPMDIIDNDSVVLLDLTSFTFAAGGSFPPYRREGPYSKQSSSPGNASAHRTFLSSSRSVISLRDLAGRLMCRK